MPCYIEIVQPPSRENYKLWIAIGYRGTYEQYAAAKRWQQGGKITICGDLGPHCADCSGVGDYLCDYPVGDDKTCDRPMCDRHAREVGQNMHYCVTHKRMWDEYKQRTGAQENETEK